MIVLLDFCSLHWLLPWLIPFLLGLLLGWLLWGRLKQMVADLNDEIDRLKARIEDLEVDLANCRAARSELESDIALLNGRIREYEMASPDDRDVSTNRVIAVGGDKDQSGDKDVSTGFTAGADDLAEDESEEVAGTDTSLAGDTKGYVDDIDKTITTGLAGTASKGKYGIAANKFSAIPESNLQIIEGVGPKMESMLKENGVDSWETMAGADLMGILGKYGDKYRIIDPASWSQQAQLARDGKWDDLISLQRSLGSRGKKTGAETDSKLEKMLVKLGIVKKWKQDDLKAVEGIGPKIARLLHDAGIITWRALANTSVSKIQSILDSAGDRYRLADPSTWPEQAGLAAEGKWDELEDLQDRLTGGRR